MWVKIPLDEPKEEDVKEELLLGPTLVTLYIEESEPPAEILSRGDIFAAYTIADDRLNLFDNLVRKNSRSGDGLRLDLLSLEEESFIDGRINRLFSA